MWIRKSKLSGLFQLVRDAAETSRRSVEAVQESSKQVEQLAALNSRLMTLLQAAPDFAIIISQANEDAIRADRFKEENDFLSGLLRLVCSPK
jgi:hypothetical protein